MTSHLPDVTPSNLLQILSRIDTSGTPSALLALYDEIDASSWRPSTRKYLQDEIVLSLADTLYTTIFYLHTIDRLTELPHAHRLETLCSMAERLFDAEAAPLPSEREDGEPSDEVELVDDPEDSGEIDFRENPDAALPWLLSEILEDFDEFAIEALANPDTTNLERLIEREVANRTKTLPVLSSSQLLNVARDPGFTEALAVSMERRQSIDANTLEGHYTARLFEADDLTEVGTIADEIISTDDLTEDDQEELLAIARERTIVLGFVQAHASELDKMRHATIMGLTREEYLEYKRLEQEHNLPILLRGMAIAVQDLLPEFREAIRSGITPSAVQALRDTMIERINEQSSMEYAVDMFFSKPAAPLPPRHPKF